MAGDWLSAGPDLTTVLSEYPRPLHTLSKAEVPSIILRRAYEQPQCVGLIERFKQRQLMPAADGVELRNGRTRRVDIGVSLANLGGDREAFFGASATARDLFGTLFDGFDDPVETLYRSLSGLAGAEGKTVRVAREPDGREYCPAIIRIHYGGHRYDPHIDHVTLREQRFDYAVTRFEHQFAGVLCLQNAIADAGRVPQVILHRHLWTEEMDHQVEEDAFRTLVAEREIENHEVDLGVGDLYFFNTRCIHEVPAVAGDQARVVLAVFIGYSDDDDEVFVWS